jgi:hypothetical protein
MRATLAWSYDLVTPEVQMLFRRLAVFVGGCTLEAAEAVCATPDGAEPLGLEVLEGLGTLVDQSLVQQREEGGEPRFGMLHIIREYALERLDISTGGTEVETLRRAHAAYYVAFAERTWSAHVEVAGGDDAAAHVRRVRPEQDNLRAALAYLRAQAEAPEPTGRTERGRTRRVAPRRRSAAAVVQGLRLSGALLWYWAYSGQLGEGHAWLAAFLDLDMPPIGAAGDQTSQEEACHLRHTTARGREPHPLPMRPPYEDAPCTGRACWPTGRVRLLGPSCRWSRA